jgi:hypothetical protein
MPKVTVTQVHEAIAASSTNPIDNELLANLIRISLDYLAQEFPGNAVELRVPPFRVVQLLTGINHRRGTPPSVIEMSPQTWLLLVSRKYSWLAAVECGLIQASGSSSDLSEIIESLN